MADDLLPTRTPPDQPLERYVRSNIERLAELFEAGFSYKALAYLLRRVGFPAANHRSVGTVIERNRRATRAASGPSTATPEPTATLDDATLVEMGAKDWK